MRDRINDAKGLRKTVSERESERLLKQISGFSRAHLRRLLKDPSGRVRRHRNRIYGELMRRRDQ